MAAKKLRSDFLSWDGFSSSGPPDKGWGWWIRKCSQEKTDGWVDKCEQKEEEASDVLGRVTLAPFLRGVLETRTLELPLWEKGAAPHSHEFSSVAQLCPTLCTCMDCSAPGFPVHHPLLELAQTRVHRVSDASNHRILCVPQMDEGHKEGRGAWIALATATKWGFVCLFVLFLILNKQQVSELFCSQNSGREVVNLYSVLTSVSPRDAVLFPVLLTESFQLPRMHRKPFSLFLGHGL